MAITGAQGEAAAVEWLRARGFTILERNWRNGRYEIDIIARRRKNIHFVEVKTRRAGGWSSPEQAITPHKFDCIMRAARHYWAVNNPKQNPQFDLVAIEWNESGITEIRMVENAMEPRW